MKKIFFLVFITIYISSSLFPHSGRTDASGGHNDRKNGGYHYHNGGSSRSSSSSTTSSRTITATQLNTYVYVNQDSNLRSGPSSSMSKVMVLSRGTTVKLLSIENGWAKVSYGNTIGWMASKLLSIRS